MSRDFVGALLQLNAEKQVSQTALIRAVEEGIQSAYRRVAGEEDIFVKVEASTGEIRVFRGRHVVDEVENPEFEVSLAEARGADPDIHVGAVLEIEQLDAEKYGRIGAQTAKQIILQRMREVERDQVFDQFASREGELITGSVSRVEPRAIILDVGKGVEAILATSEQSPLGALPDRPAREGLRPRGPPLGAWAADHGVPHPQGLPAPAVRAGGPGDPRRAPSRSRRSPGRRASRTKVAVASRQDGLDPVGATVGQRGARVQAVVAELGGEKIDVIPWSEDAAVFVANALSPAQVSASTWTRQNRVAQRHRPGADAVAGDRPRGPERPARRQADRLAHRHPQRRAARGAGTGAGARRRRARRRERARAGARRGRRAGAGGSARAGPAARATSRPAGRAEPAPREPAAEPVAVAEPRARSGARRARRRSPAEVHEEVSS